jgi:cytochrome c556
MKNFVKSLTRIAGAGAIASALFLAGNLNAQTDLAGAVDERQKLMKTMGKSFGPIIAILKGQSTDLAAAGAAAQTMNDSIVKAVGLFPAGSAAGSVPGARAKPDVWSNAAEFKAAADALIDATANLVVAAKSGDVNTFKAQFGPVGKACGGCHEGPPKKGGKFRIPKDS